MLREVAASAQSQHLSAHTSHSGSTDVGEPAATVYLELIAIGRHAINLVMPNMNPPTR